MDTFCGCSYSCMHGHDKVEAVLHTLQEDFPVIDIDIEFPFQCIVHKDACLYVNVVVLTVPVGLEGHWHAVPSLGVSMSQSIADCLDDALRQHIGLDG